MTESLGREPWIDARLAEAATAVEATHSALQRERAAGVPWDASLMITMTGLRAQQALRHRSPTGDIPPVDVWLATTIGTRLSQELQAIRELPEHD